MNGVSQPNRSCAGEGHRVATVASWHDAIKHVDATCDGFDDIFRPTNSHQIAGLVRRLSGNTQNRVEESRTQSAHGVNGESIDPFGFAWRLQATLAKLQELQIEVLSVETQQSNLERVFLNLTGKQLRD